MAEEIREGTTPDETARWEYKVIRVSVGSATFQKYGPDSLGFEATLNEWGDAGWEAFHAQAFAEGEALLLFLKRRRNGLST
jgi:hypothetical protein